MKEEDAQELHREWRAIVLAKLTTLENGQRKLEEDMTAMRLHFVQKEELTKLELRVRELENTKIKVLTLWAILQGIAVLVGWFISLFFKR